MGNWGECWGGVCGGCHGVMKFVLGLLLLAWAWWWPATDWRVFFGAVLVLLGALKFLKPSCGHCGGAPAGKKKR